MPIPQDNARKSGQADRQIDGKDLAILQLKAEIYDLSKAMALKDLEISHLRTHISKNDRENPPEHGEKRHE